MKLYSALPFVVVALAVPLNNTSVELLPRVSNDVCKFVATLWRSRRVQTHWAQLSISGTGIMGNGKDSTTATWLNGETGMNRKDIADNTATINHVGKEGTRLDIMFKANAGNNDKDWHKWDDHMELTFTGKNSNPPAYHFQGAWSQGGVICVTLPWTVQQETLDQGWMMYKQANCTVPC